MMDEFEQKLKALATREPSAGLDARVAAALAEGAAAHAAGEETNRPAHVASNARRADARRRWSISLPWALAAALLVGLIGFAAGRWSIPSPSASPTSVAGVSSTPASAPVSVTVRVYYEGTGPNPFDFTVAADDGLRAAAAPRSTFTPGV